MPSTSARNIAAVLAPIGHPSGVTWVAGLWWPLSLPGNSNGLIVSVFALWACGFVLIALVRLDAWRRIRATVRASTPFQVVGAEMLARVPVRSAPGLLQPGVVGWLRPILLLPAGIEQHLTVPQLHAVLTHELCHVKRRDNFTAGLQMISEAVFWFHSLVWWIGARLVEERESACDEEVLRLGCNPHAVRGRYSQNL